MLTRPTRSITVRVPADVLARARAATGKGIPETVRLGLEAVVSAVAAQDFRSLRGKVKLDIDPIELRRDRR